MFMRTKTHNAIVDALTFQKESLEDDVRDLRETNYALDRTAAKYKQERDEARAKIARMTGGLRRGSKPANAA